MYWYSIDTGRTSTTYAKSLAQTWVEGANQLLVDSVCLPELSTWREEGFFDGVLAKCQSPDVVFYFGGAIGDPSQIDAERQCVLEASQALMNRAGAGAVQFYYCYPAASSDVRVHQGLSGLFRAIAMECPTLCARSVEYPAIASPRDYAAIVREWLHYRPAEYIPAQIPMVRFRDGRRYTTALSEVADAMPATVPARFRHGATYLMVGALGEVGRLVCHALARSYQPRLVIVSRRPLDAEVRQQLASLSKAGAEVIYRSVDIAIESHVIESLAEIKAEVGVIHGVFHFARSVSDGPVRGKTYTSFRKTIAAKVDGTVNIDKATVGEPLDFFIVYSSMASFGIEGSADYGYATAFQNAFVRYRNELVDTGTRTGRSLAFCWGQWAVDTYMSKQRSELIKKLGFDFIYAGSAIPLMEEGLKGADDVVGLIAVTDKEHAIRHYGLSESDTSVEEMPEGQTEMTSLERDLVELLKDGSGGIDVVKQILLEKSHGQLAELYEEIRVR